MGFVNEIIAPDEKKNIDFSRIAHPTGMWTFEPNKWCIDRGRDAVFLRVPRRGRPEPEDPLTYAMILRGEVIRLWLFRETERADRLTVRWRLSHMDIPESGSISKSEVLTLLRDALGVYGLHGLEPASLLPQEPFDVECLF